MIDKAVILAAGQGNRIGALSGELPKPLLPLSGIAGSIPTFLDWHARALERAGCKEAYFVGNSKTFGTPLPSSASMGCTWILNPTPDLSTSGSAHSTWFAWNSGYPILDGKSRVVLMDADLLYHPDILNVLAAHPSKHSKTLVCTDFRNTQEEVLVFADPKAPHEARLHGKGLQNTPMTEGYICTGEATGILLWEPGDHEALARITDWIVHYSTAKTRSEHEDISQRMMLLGRVHIAGFGPELPFMECDMPSEYETITKEMYPRLRDCFSF